MPTRRTLLASAAAALLPAASARAQCAPVDLGIPNIQQRTQVWCWAAVAEQLITWRTGGSPPQCELVAFAYGEPGEPCCTGRAPCAVTGSLEQIQALLWHFAALPSQQAPPAHPTLLYQTLAVGRPIVLAVRSSPFAGHVVVLRGMSCWGPEPILHVNDPLAWAPLTQPVAFAQIMPFWQAAIVVG